MGSGTPLSGFRVFGGFTLGFVAVYRVPDSSLQGIVYNRVDGSVHREIRLFPHQMDSGARDREFKSADPDQSPLTLPFLDYKHESFDL
jgi:hypothetical protein